MIYLLANGLRSQIETNQSPEMVTGDTGAYSFTNVLTGTYTVCFSDARGW